MKVALISFAIASIATSAVAVERGYEPPATQSECFVLTKHKGKVKPAKKKPYKVVRIRISPPIEERWKLACTVIKPVYMTYIVWDEPLVISPVEFNSTNLIPSFYEPEPPAYLPPLAPLGGFPGRVSAVPEPSSWALMVAGFGLVGSCARMNRRKPPSKI